MGLISAQDIVDEVQMQNSYLAIPVPDQGSSLQQGQLPQPFGLSLLSHGSGETAHDDLANMQFPNGCSKSFS